MLVRLAYLVVTNAFAALRLLPLSDGQKDMEILALRHQLGVLERQLDGGQVRFEVPRIRVSVSSGSGISTRDLFGAATSSQRFGKKSRCRRRQHTVQAFWCIHEGWNGA